jgi:hypothetical protein
MTNVINLNGLNYTGTDAIDRLVKAFNPLISHLGVDDVWLRERIFEAMLSGQSLAAVTQGAVTYARHAGLEVQGYTATSQASAA